MNVKTITVAISLLVAARPALAWEEHTIDSINEDAIITLDDGRAFQLSDDTSGWNDGDSVLLNDGGDRMLNKENQERSDVDEVEPPEDE